MSIGLALRRKVFTFLVRRRARQTGERLTVNGRSNVNQNTVLGNNVNFNGMRVNGQGPLHIGNNFHSGRDCLIITQNHRYDNATAVPYDSSYTRKGVIIEDNVWLGDRVIILDGSHISEGAIIQAGSVVASHIPYCAIVGGHPAKPFKYRDIDQYEKLKGQQRFH